MYGTSGDQGRGKSMYADIETGEPSLYPGISYGDNALRWAFIQKVYGILSVQVLLTMAVCSVVVFTDTVRDFVLRTPGVLLVIAICPLILMCALSAYHRSHPTNMILLALFTVSLSLTVGLACAFTPGEIVLEALVLTSAVVLALTAYTYWAVRQGYDFSFLGPMLFAALLVLVLWGFIQMFFPVGSTGQVIYALLGALLFSFYIIYDTDNLIKRYSYDEYIWASVALYLDVVNLFISLLNLLRAVQSGGD